MNSPVIAACVQAEPVVLDLERTLDKLESLAAEAAGNGAGLVVFPETFVPVYPTSTWAKAFAGWQDDRAMQTFARLAENSVAVGSKAERRLGAAAEELGIWLVTGVNEVEPERPGHDLQRAALPRARRQPRAPPSQARADEPRAAHLGPGRRPRPHRRRDRLRPDRRVDLLGELHAARTLRALRGRRRDLHRLDGR